LGSEALSDVDIPNPQHTPAERSQLAIHAAVARLIRQDLPLPPFWKSPRAELVGVAVPERTVHEDSDLELAEDQIRVTGQILRIGPPASDSDGAQGLSQRDLRHGVLAADAAHEPATPLLGEPVGHDDPLRVLTEAGSGLCLHQLVAAKHQEPFAHKTPKPDGELHQGGSGAYPAQLTATDDAVQLLPDGIVVGAVLQEPSADLAGERHAAPVDPWRFRPADHVPNSTP
jgi:hypothetical protein